MEIPAFAHSHQAKDEIGQFVANLKIMVSHPREDEGLGLLDPNPFQNVVLAQLPQLRLPTLLPQGGRLKGTTKSRGFRKAGTW